MPPIDESVKYVPVKTKYPDQPPATPEWARWEWIQVTAFMAMEYPEISRRLQEAADLARANGVNPLEDRDCGIYRKRLNECGEDVYRLFREIQTYFPLEIWGNFQHIRSTTDAMKNPKAAIAEWKKARDYALDKLFKLTRAGAAPVQPGRIVEFRKDAADLRKLKTCLESLLPELAGDSDFVHLRIDCPWIEIGKLAGRLGIETPIIVEGFQRGVEYPPGCFFDWREHFASNPDSLQITAILFRTPEGEDDLGCIDGVIYSSRKFPSGELVTPAERSGFNRKIEAVIRMWIRWVDDQLSPLAPPAPPAEIVAVASQQHAPPLNPAPAVNTPADKPAKGKKTNKEALALAALVQHPEWNDEKIANEAGCRRESLYRMKKYMAAKNQMRAGKGRFDNTIRPVLSKSSRVKSDRMREDNGDEDRM